MSKITAGLFITLDGVIEAPHTWNPPYYDDELGQAVMPQLTAAATHLYGRRSYEMFRSVFTGANAPPHASLMTAKPKVVVSTALDDASWGPTTVIKGNVAAELAQLKDEQAGDISVGASGTLVRYLLAEGLLDELRLLVHPVVVGTGRHLFEDGSGQVPLTLLEARPHSNGVVMLRYGKA